MFRFIRADIHEDKSARTTEVDLLFEDAAMPIGGVQRHININLKQGTNLQGMALQFGDLANYCLIASQKDGIA
jgi:hypothetical protein